MCSTEKAQKLTSASELSMMLEQPEGWHKALRLLPILIFEEIHETKRQMSLIEAGFGKLKEANAAQGTCNDAIEKQLEELRKDKDGFRLLISEAEAGVQASNYLLKDLREKVSDEYFKLTADNARFGKDIKSLNKQIDSHREQLSSVEKALGGFCSKLPGTQEEITKLNETLSRLEPMVKSMYEKVDKVSMVATDKRNRDALMETASGQEHIHHLRHFLDAFIPRQDMFLQFLEKLPETSTPDTSSVTTTNGVTDGLSLNPRSSEPQPPPKAHQVLEKYNYFSSSYRLKRPRSEAKFIRAYLKHVDQRAAWLMQTKLQKEYPDLVTPLERAERSKTTDVIVFINVEKLEWGHIKTMMHQLDGNELFKLLEADREELDIPVPVPPRKRRRKSAY
ncbi:hypothetical protein F4677DRAFT_440014 [Hypoxylon crocopeplum]|nr:hypothetical protein F4677DRAFT_440014 [Hypoxylon crocopeplum]